MCVCVYCIDRSLIWCSCRFGLSENVWKQLEDCVPVVEALGMLMLNAFIRLFIHSFVRVLGHVFASVLLLETAE